MSDTAWATPGVPLPRTAPGPSPDVVALARAVDDALGTDPLLLAGPQALARAEAVLALQERLHALALTAVADVDARDLWEHAAAGSTRTWLRTLPAGDRGQLADARALAGAPLLAAALAEGTVSLRTATALARQLDRVPDAVADGQLEGVLVDGVGQLLSVWAGAACLDPTPAQAVELARRQQRVAEAVEQGRAAACWSTPAAALEPALVLAAQVLAPAEALAGAALLVDALQPEPDLDAEAEQQHAARDLVLRRLREGGWSLRGHLTDEAGQLLHDELADREERHALAGPGTGADAVTLPLPAPRGTVEGAPLPSRGQRAHDALVRLLGDLAGVAPGSGAPAPAHVTVTCTLAALQGEPGALAGVLRTEGGDVALTPGALRRHACSGVLAAVLVDAHGRPVGASGEHRHATPRERRAMRAAWGSGCAVNGCGRAGVVPHHVEPFWKSRRTRLADLAPVCEHHHHDVHDGHKTLRLRDGRLIDELGWVDAAWR